MKQEHIDAMKRLMPSELPIPYVLWEGYDGVNDIRLVVTFRGPDNEFAYVIEKASQDAMKEECWLYDSEYTQAVTGAETFVPCVVSGLVDLLMR